MKKTLTISLVNNNFVINSNDGKSVTVLRSNLSLNGKDVYENFLFDAVIGKPYDLNVIIDETIVGEYEKHIASDIKSLIDKIIAEINKKAVSKESGDENAGDIEEEQL